MASTTKTLSMGPETHEVPVSMFKDNRQRVCEALTKVPTVLENSIVLLEGGDNVPLYNTDVDYLFKQVRCVLWFSYLTFLRFIIPKLYSFAIY